MEVMTCSVKKDCMLVPWLELEMRIWDQHKGTCVKVVQKMGSWKPSVVIWMWFWWGWLSFWKWGLAEEPQSLLNVSVEELGEGD